MKRHPALVRLSWDHHHGLVFALRLERELPAASGDEVAALYNDLLSFWARGLLPHFHGESDCLLARLINHREPGDSLVQRVQGDHLGMANLVARMRDAATDDQRRPLLAEFGATLKQHIRWEESDLFEAVQADLPPAEMDRLGEELDAVLPALEEAPRGS